jgi:GNAT superfamily N-acetyltransferase
MTWLVRAPGSAQRLDVWRCGDLAGPPGLGQVAAKPPPSHSGDSGRMMTGGRDPVTPLLLVRRAVVAEERDVEALLREIPLDLVEVADLMRHHRVLVLCDLTLPSAAPPVAAAAFRLHRPTCTAQLAGIGVAVHLRRRGLARRLLTGALMLLRAEGVERVQACAAPGGAGVSLLASIGFAADYGTDWSDGRTPLVLPL